MKVIAVVPAHNEASVIAAVVRSLHTVGVAVVVVDDGSRDRTAAVAEAAGAIVLQHLINRGQGAALETGTRYALDCGADVVVHFDADGQHDAADIPALVQPIATEQAAVVLGSRFLGRAPNMPFARRFVLRLGALFMRWYAGLRLTDAQNGLRAFSRLAARQMHITHDGMAHASEILDTIADRNLPYVEVPVTVRYTPYSLARGQGSLNSLQIVKKLIIDKFFSL